MNYCWHSSAAARTFPDVQARGPGLERQKGGGGQGRVGLWTVGTKWPRSSEERASHDKNIASSPKCPPMSVSKTMIFLLGGEKTQKKGKRKWADTVECLDLPRYPHEQLAHPGAPRLGAMATTASWSPLYMGMKTPWWRAASVHGVGCGRPRPKRPLQLPAAG